MSFSSSAKIARSEGPKPSKHGVSKKMGSSTRRLTKCRSERPCKRGRSPASRGVAQRLDALKELIPSMGSETNATADEIFEGTADYILLLRTRVEILKHLVHFHGDGLLHDDDDNINAPVS